MSDMTSNAGGLTIDAEFGTAPQPFSVDETYWGYIVRKTTRPTSFTIIMQALSMFLGASFAAAALGLLLAPASVTGSDFTMRAVAAVLFGAVSAYLLWFASRGSQSEIQVDTSLGEVREVVRNRAGRPSLIGRYGFDAIGGVFLERSSHRGGTAQLVLRYRNTSQTLPVAEADEDDLLALRDRLGRDLMSEARGAGRRRAASRL